jgi:hypothetical protein
VVVGEEVVLDPVHGGADVPEVPGAVVDRVAEGAAAAAGLLAVDAQVVRRGRQNLDSRLRRRYVGSGAGCSLGGWKESLASCYGSMADAPIERGKPGELEIPGPLR